MVTDCYGPDDVSCVQSWHWYGVGPAASEIQTALAFIRILRLELKLNTACILHSPVHVLLSQKWPKCEPTFFRKNPKRKIHSIKMQKGNGARCLERLGFSTNSPESISAARKISFFLLDCGLDKAQCFLKYIAHACTTKG